MTQVKTKTIELPTFEQLTPEEQRKVIQNYYDINVDFSWYEDVYEDAKSIGCSIKSFELDRGNNIEFEFTQDALIVASNIKHNHGKDTDTYKIAIQYINDEHELQKMYANDKEFNINVALEYLNNLFEKTLSQEYLSMLKKEYEDRTSEEPIKDTLIANEYTFNRETLKIDS